MTKKSIVLILYINKRYRKYEYGKNNQFINFFYDIYTTTFSQHILEGNVFNAKTNEVIIWANVVLYQNRTVIKGVITSEEGKFTINNLHEGEYKLKVSFIGYKTIELPIAIPRKDAAKLSIKLEADNTLLENVLIQAELTTVQHKSDRKIVNVGKDLFATGAAAGEILSQLPSITVDETYNISLRGDQNIKISVNGKNSSLPNDRLLQQIPSEAIYKIEIINNPSAKYQAEGLSGIINIITKKSYLKGGSINISLGLSADDKPRSNGNLNVSYTTNKLKVFMDYNYRQGYSKFFSTNEEERQNLSFSTDLNRLNTWEFPAYVKGGVDYHIDSTNTISGFIEYSEFSYNGLIVNKSEQRLSVIPTSYTLLNVMTINNGEGQNTNYNLNCCNQSKYYKYQC